MRKHPLPPLRNSLRAKLLKLVDLYCRHSKLSRSTVSDRFIDNSAVLDRVASNLSDINTSTFERVVQAISDDWPANVEWPEFIERPQTARAE